MAKEKGSTKPLLGRRIIPDYGNVKDPDIRAKYGYLEAAVSIVGNILLFALKLTLGLFLNSIALVADAVHTLSDVGTSAVVIFGFKMAKKPADKEHPHGHGRMEYIATLVIAVLLILTALYFLQESGMRLWEGAKIVHKEYALLIGIVIIVSAFVKEAMAQYSLAISKRIDSDMLKADAWHHRSDAIATVLVGVSIIVTRYGFWFIDPIFGLLVSGIIIYVGVDLIRNSSNILLGKAPEFQSLKEIKEIAASVKGVKDIHKVDIHDYGTTKVVSFHAVVAKDLPMKKAHRIADRLEKRIGKDLGYSTIVHLEPADLSAQDESVTEDFVKDLLEKQKEVVSYHKVQIIYQTEEDTVRVHLIVDKDMSVADSHDLCHRLEKKVKKKYRKCSLDIHLEPCGKNCKVCTFTCSKRPGDAPP
jgi:cation diffusion facilitator family transporter